MTCSSLVINVPLTSKLWTHASFLLCLSQRLGQRSVFGVLELKLPSKMVIMLVLKVSYRLSGAPLGIQGAVTPIGTVVTAKTGVKKWSTGQRVVLPLVKGSRTIFITWYCKIVESQDI